MRILIAEDELDSRDLLTILLMHEGHEVVATTNGREAWEAFQQESFSLTISDWLMPEMDGLDLCRRIRMAVRPNYSYVILLTALAGKSNYLEGMYAGADDFVTKPYDPDQLKVRLTVAERIVRLHQHVRGLEGILPTCMYCKKIRDHSNVWVGMEHYIAQRTDASFSHGVCPECYESVVKPELDRLR